MAKVVHVVGLEATASGSMRDLEVGKLVQERFRGPVNVTIYRGYSNALLGLAAIARVRLESSLTYGGFTF